MTLARTICMLAMAVCAFSAVAPPAAAQDNREFRDWAAQCDSNLACEAYTHHVGDDPGAYLFHLTRRKDEAGWNLVLQVVDGHPERPYDIYVNLQGGPEEFSARVDAAPYGRADDLHLLGANAKMLMEQLGPASEASFEYIDDDGDLHDPRFSLSGLSASLLWVDEKQGRIGSPREAGNPPEGLQLAEVAGSIAVPEEVLIMHDRQDDCEAPEDLPNGDEVVAVTLNGERTLYLVPCFAGAYNFAHAAYVESNGYFSRLRFADYTPHSSWTVSDVIVNPEWNAATGRLSMFNRGRGLGDCGSIAEWMNHDGFLRLERFSYKGECDAEGEPGDFPLVYEAKPIER